MNLYGSYTSPYVRHCRIELSLAGFEYNFHVTDYADSDKGSPTKRVPYFTDGDLVLTDSTSILLYLRSKQALPFIDTAAEMDLYCMVNTALDAAINLFILEREGQSPVNNDYLARQAARIETALGALNNNELPMAAPYSIAQVRLACFLAWGRYRERFSITGLAQLESFLNAIERWPEFATTAPPAA